MLRSVAALLGSAPDARSLPLPVAFLCALELFGRHAPPVASRKPLFRDLHPAAGAVAMVWRDRRLVAALANPRASSDSLTRTGGVVASRDRPPIAAVAAGVLAAFRAIARIWPLSGHPPAALSTFPSNLDHSQTPLTAGVYC